MTDQQSCLMERIAVSTLKRRYRFGAELTLDDPDPKGFRDCSENVQWIFYQWAKQTGKTLLLDFIAEEFDGSFNQFAHSLPVRALTLTGDLGFFHRPFLKHAISHVGILIGQIVIEARGRPFGEVIPTTKEVFQTHPRFVGWMRPRFLTENTG